MERVIEKKTIKNIIKVAIGNIITLLAGVLVGFALPKIVGITDYGYYKTFTLYASYVGLLHIGITDGIYLKYGGQKYEELEAEKEKFRLYNFLVILLDVSFSLTLCLTSFFVPNADVKFVLIALALYLIVCNIVGHFQIISQITNRFNELAIRNIIQSILIIISISLLWIFNRYLNYEISYKVYTIIYIGIFTISAIYYLIRYRTIVFGKKAKILENKNEIGYLIKIGIPLLIANLCTGFILNIDRQIVNIFWPVSESNVYSIYAFAYNLLSLVTIAISAISTVIYPTLKKASEESLKENYSKLITIILSVNFLCLVLYYPLCAFITWFLPKYEESLVIFRVIFPGIVLSSTISIVMHNYYKTIGKSTLYFIFSVVILALSLISDLIVYFIFKSTIAISIASIFCIALWYIITDLYFIKKYNIKFFKNYSFIIVMTSAFYLLTMIENVYIGFAIHFVSTVVIVYLYNYKLVNGWIRNKIMKKEFE